MIESIYSIFKPKKIFLEKKIDLPRIDDRKIDFVKKFKNGNILVTYGSTTILLFDKTYKFIYEFWRSDKFLACTYVNTKQFIILYNSGIHLFTEIFQEENNEDINAPLIKKKIFDHDFLYTISNCLDNIIYNKNKLFLANKAKMCIFYFFPKTKKIGLQTIIKHNIKLDITSFILFRNIYLMITFKSLHDRFYCYDIKKASLVLRYTILNPPQEDNTEELYYYDNKFFMLKTDYKCFIYNFDENNIYYMNTPLLPEYLLKITKNYLFIIVNDYVFGVFNKDYDNITFEDVHNKRLLKPSKNIEEIEDGKIGVFIGNQVLIYSKNNKIKIIGVALIRYLLIFILFFILPKSLSNDLLDLILKKFNLSEYLSNQIGIVFFRLIIYFIVNFFILVFISQLVPFYNGNTKPLISDFL